jgi:hypothetical protein
MHNRFNNHQICIIGNSENSQAAIQMHKQWSGAFPSIWNIWGDGASIKDVGADYNNIHFTFNPRLTWAQGLLQTLKISRQLYSCEYFFTHDDDLRFYSSNGLSIHELLENILLEYRPAVASFPYGYLIENQPNAARLNGKFQDTRVAPLVGFDSGMVIYHHSIVDFFIPFSPRGEGGFNGEWSLCAHFLNMFAPLIFKEYAIQINQIKYTNDINMDNINKEEKKRFHLNAFGQKVPDGSRHPYEYEMNVPFKKYLESGLLVQSIRWGRQLDVHDVTWFPQRYFESSYNERFVLQRLKLFYNLSHPLIQNNIYMKKYFTPKMLSEISQSQHTDASNLKDETTRCTMVLTVYDRFSLTSKLLEYYHKFNILESIVVIWNNPDVPLPTVSQNF